MTTAPDQYMIDHTLRVAAQSPCRSQRGVTIYDMTTGAFRGAGFNGSPGGCPGRSVCAGTCGQRAVHAEVRALRVAARYIESGHPPGPYDLIHVELAAGPFTIDVARSADGSPTGQAPHIISGQVAACSGPSCPGCAAQILDVGFVGGVWLYEQWPTTDGGWIAGVWHRYTATEFYAASMRTVRP